MLKSKRGFKIGCMEDILMFLCDIGNSSYHFYKDNKTFKKNIKNFDPSTIQEKIYYISVNNQVDISLKKLKNWISLENFVDRSKYYQTMGIDRIVACEVIEHGIVIDAGSAITVDKVQNGVYQGGFIYPGVYAMSQCYKNISPALAYPFHYGLNFDIMPKNSQDAISYGYLKTLYSEVISHQMPLYLTGGDAKLLADIFSDALVDELLLFKGMQKILQRANLC